VTLQVSSVRTSGPGDLKGARCEPEQATVFSLKAPVVPLHAALPGQADDVVLLAPAEGLCRVGWGWARSHVTSGPQRLEHLDAWCRQTLGAISLEGCTAPAPVLVTGFAFEDEVEGAWAAFGAARAVLPRYSYIKDGAQAWLQIVIEADEDRAQALEHARQILGRLHTPSATPSMSATLGEQGSRESWSSAINSAQAHMASGAAKKVVLSRRMQLRLDASVRPRTAVARVMGSRAPGTRFVFAVQGQAFVGVTPERLVAVQGDHVHSAALAGSMPEPQGDGARLIQDAKEREEHALVAEHVEEALSVFCDDLRVPEHPEVLRLGYVSHLFTPMQGTLTRPASLFEVARRLHPTPAVGGVPTATACAIIKEAEPTPRGWYTGGIGQVSASGQGELWVALRSALLSGDCGLLFVGAGIVPASNAAREWQETHAKAQAMLMTLGANAP